MRTRTRICARAHARARTFHRAREDEVSMCHNQQTQKQLRGFTSVISVPEVSLPNYFVTTTEHVVTTTEQWCNYYRVTV